MAFGCCSRPSRFAALSRAAAKYAGAIARRAGAAGVHPDWTIRAAVCEQCPLRVVAGSVSYCGQPMQRKPLRDPSLDGCGCPTREKAKAPDEHCPLTPRHQPAASEDGVCDCKWCVL
jgi:hypothetical protein